MKTEYPVYRKDNVGTYKVIDENTCVHASSGYMPEIAFCEPSLAFYLDSSVEATESEFLEAYFDVRKKLDYLCLIKID